ncbi:chitin synthase chs-2-like [Saccostrea cucullata]|uniref:chitin synthase chs-2-like n=1 Tax=Saccostrea cuccullata TaxID=36930 RepID=UPI002ED484A0
MFHAFCIYIPYWHRAVLQELVFEKRKMMNMEHQTVLSDSETDLDTTYDVLVEALPNDSSICMATKASCLSEKQMSETTVNSDNLQNFKTGTQQKVTEWMQQNNENTMKVRKGILFSNLNLQSRLWDRFQMIPRERVSTSDTLKPFLRAFKAICYVLLFCIVLGSAVAAKTSILIMTSSIVKDENARNVNNSPTNTMLIICICFPYALWILTYTARSLFGSSAWPSFKTTTVTLFIELLHSFGLCLLVFHILPKMDMARSLIPLSGIFVIPALLKTLFVISDKSLPGIKRLTLTTVHGIAFLIQFCNLGATSMFSIPLTDNEKQEMVNSVIDNDDVINVIERPKPILTNRIMWELPVSLVFISLSYWENYADGDIYICSFRIPLLDWKKNLLVVKQRLYILTGLWKIGWTMIFAILLIPGFNFSISFSDSDSSNSSMKSISNVPFETTTNPLGNDVSTISPNIRGKRSLLQVASENQNMPNLEKPDTVNNDAQINLTRAIKDRGIESVLHLNENMLTRNLVVPQIVDKDQNIDEKQNSNSTSSSYIPEVIQVNLQKYGVLYLHLVATTLMSYFGGLACKLCMQLFGFTLPIILATPITFGLVLVQQFTEYLPSYVYVWVCPETDGDLRKFHLLWLGVLWISQLITTAHIWSPRNGRMAKIERLFVTPLRCGILTDTSLALRRRLNDRDTSLFNADEDWSFIYDDDEIHKADDVVPQIYACATMWHETRNEMIQLLKSLFRIDVDHSGRYLAQKFYGIRDPDYYEFEAHIFFDDAMDLTDDENSVPNAFVVEFMDSIDDALSSVHERQLQLGPPMRTATPYGARLTWLLPGATKLVVHLKDRHRVRHKKRWSQVMYMYYLLGYRILAQPENLLHRDFCDRSFGSSSEDANQRVRLTNSQLRHRRQASHFTRSVIFNYTTEEVHTQAENTFILTLDGDVDFKPDAVRLLVDRLKKNKKVGAACGRIHPIGSGPIIWYQEFEYAIGHWLQKATEHVFGCVLCAPGCFSLFRGSALMDDNVARCYAIRASEAGHYVQYDQGEDRWLSTLLLQQGYRIDYCAAADALTHAPETFSEFFNQRRRWGPSTLANLIDLLGDWKNTVRLNDNISTPYILYQFFLLVSTILGPATVLLMMAGAFTVVFKTTIIESYAIALTPAIALIIVCLYAKPSTQIIFATIASASYAIVMTIVLVGTVGTAIEGGLTSPNVVFLSILVIIYFIAALLHPEEFTCVIPGALYFICIPTGYLVLTIYYLCNMHVVSWGTREVTLLKGDANSSTKNEAEEEKKKKKKEKKTGILGWLGITSIINETVELFRQVRTMTLANTEKPTKTDQLLEELIIELKDKRLPKELQSEGVVTSSKPDIMESSTKSMNIPPISEDYVNNKGKTETKIYTKTDQQECLQNQILGDGPIKKLDEREVLFWKQLLQKYLYPIKEDKLHQERVVNALKNLRNNVVFGFFMTSALWIALTMQLQLLQDDFKDTDLFIKIPHFDSSQKDLTFEPLGMIFLALFSAILLFQFLGMLSHRWGTILHVLSITDISCSQKFTEKYKIQEVIAKAMELQRVSNIENEPEPDYDDPLPDYEDDDIDDDDEAISTLYTSSCSSMSTACENLGSNFQDARQKRRSLRRKNSAVFNRRGLTTGRTLRRAFERRYRNQLRGDRNGDQHSDSGFNFKDNEKNDGFLSV